MLIESPCLTPCTGSNVVDIFDALHPAPPYTTATPLSSSVPVISSSAPFPPQTSAFPHPTSPLPPPFPPSAGSLCTSDCGICCCPGCHAVNGTCFLCSAGSFSTGCSDHLQSSCRACPAGFFCPQGATQPYLPWSTLAVIIACVVVVHIVLACVFLRSKRLIAAHAKLWILAVMIFGPFAWLFWWFQHRAVNRPQPSALSLKQPMLAEHHASASLPDIEETPILKPSAAAASAAVAITFRQRVVSTGGCDQPLLAQHQASAPPLDIDEIPILKPSEAAAGAAAAVAVKPRVAVAGGGIAAAVHERQVPGALPSQAPNDDDVPADMTDQCRRPLTCVAVRRQRVV